ncbi:helix-turn-helix domain-containing protein, partial [Mycolicibacterium fortuitum]|uniref:helix-turn-helix domain-containing protein n=1 Tax=Mycolicibacterium fortuitum TaxID=1766 RepID=UPI0013F60DD2
VVRAAIQELSDEQIRGAITALVRGLITGMLGDIVGRADEIVDNVVHSICDQIAAAAEPQQDESAAAVPESAPTSGKPRTVRGPSLTPQQDEMILTRYRSGEPVPRIAFAYNVSRPTIYNAIKRAEAAEASENASDIRAKDIPANVTPADDNPLPRAHRLIGELVDGVADKVLGAPARVDDSAARSPATRPAAKSPQVIGPKAVDQSAPARPQPMPRVTVTRAAKPDTTARCSDCSRTWNLTGRVLDHAIQLHEMKHDHIVDILNLEHPANA